MIDDVARRGVAALRRDIHDLKLILSVIHRRLAGLEEEE